MSKPALEAGVNRYILSGLRGSPAELYGAARHLISSGGKRLRPFLLLKSCVMLGGTRRRAMPAAAAIEMVHNFTLAHDDIMDNDEMRHGVPTIHSKFGLPTAILAGDVLFSKAYQQISDSGLKPDTGARLVSLLAGACIEVCEGQMLDITMAEKSRRPSSAQYIRMISKKTAALFDVSCAMGAVCAGAPGRDIRNLSAFGRNLGIAFQITDDLIGVLGDPGITKKPVGNDLREGKKSLPILLAISRARGEARRTILESFGNPRATRKSLAESVSAIRELGIEDEIRGRAVRYARRAEAALSTYGESKSRNDLQRLLDFVIERRL